MSFGASGGGAPAPFKQNPFSTNLQTRLNPVTDTSRYAPCIEVPPRIRGNIDQDVTDGLQPNPNVLRQT